MCVRESGKERDSQTFQQTNDPVTAIKLLPDIFPPRFSDLQRCTAELHFTQNAAAPSAGQAYSVTLKTQTFSADVKQNHRPTDSSH